MELDRTTMCILAALDREEREATYTVSTGDYGQEWKSPPAVADGKSEEA